jgi:hypothetical protein
MSATPPEANTEYSRAPGDSRAGSRSARGRLRGAVTGVLATPGWTRGAVLASGLLGAVILFIAEFTPLFHTRLAASSAPVTTVLTGAHHDYALVPIAALALLLATTAVRDDRRPALLALGALGLVALLIAIVGDLPDAQSRGLVGSSTTHYALASSAPAIGVYLESLGAVLLLLASGLGVLLTGPPETASRPDQWFAS